MMLAGDFNVSHSRLSGTDDEADGELVTSESECENCGQVPALESSVSSGQFWFVSALTAWPWLAHLRTSSE